VKVPAAEIVEGSIAVLNVAAILWLRGTLIARSPGFVEVTVGALAFVVTPVVKLQT
jgi:hypothetical protein